MIVWRWCPTQEVHCVGGWHWCRLCCVSGNVPEFSLRMGMVLFRVCDIVPRNGPEQSSVPMEASLVISFMCMENGQKLEILAQQNFQFYFRSWVLISHVTTHALHDAARTILTTFTTQSNVLYIASMGFRILKTHINTKKKWRYKPK